MSHFNDTAAYFTSAEEYALTYPPGSSLSSGLAMPSLFMPTLAHSSQSPHFADDSSMVLRSLYPAVGSSVSASGFDTSVPVYRGMTMAASQDPAPFHFQPAAQTDSGYSSHAQKEASLANGFVPMQQPMFSKPTGLSMQLEVPSLVKLASPAPAVATPVVPLSSASACPAKMPSWVEPHSHFFCSASAAEDVFQTVVATLHSLHSGCAAAADESMFRLDVSSVPDRFKVHATAYPLNNGSSTPFCVRVYSAEQDKYCVEFQREHGSSCDRRHFHHLYQTAKCRIESQHPVHGHKAQTAQIQAAPAMDMGALAMPSLLSWSAPPLPASAVEPAALAAQSRSSSVCESVRSLLQMCSSEHDDVKLQGVLALAELSSNQGGQSFCQAVHEVLVAEGCHQLFLDCLPVQHADLHRASLTALANLSATQQSLCAQVLSDEKNLAVIMQLAKSEQSTGHVVRECARFLANCAARLGVDLMTNLPTPHKQSFPQLVQDLTHHEDVHCRQHAADIAHSAGLIAAL